MSNIIVMSDASLGDLRRMIGSRSDHNGKQTLRRHKEEEIKLLGEWLVLLSFLSGVVPAYVGCRIHIK